MPATLVERAEGRALRQRMSWWAALALLRCISSSPAAAVNALRTRLAGGSRDTGAAGAKPGGGRGAGRERVLDGADDDLSTQDIEPAA
jgi:hypothetical protein